MENHMIAAYKRAEKKVKRIKGFYGHLTAYLIVNSIIVISGFGVLKFRSGSLAELEPDFTQWITWNMFGTAIFWGIGLLIHGIRVFGPGLSFVREWEELQLRKFLEEENKIGNKTGRA